jgi:nucleotide-binding universal stress UspA family protein
MREAMRVLLAVDGSECSLAAVEEAARTPWPERSEVRIVSVAEIPIATTPRLMSTPGGSYEEWERIFEERSVENIAQAMARFGEIAGAQTEVSTKILKGDPKAALLDEAERWRADLLIVGTHGYNALKRLWLGSVSRAVAAHAKCSVQIVRRKPPVARAEALKILLAVDGSACGKAAVEEIAFRPWPRGSEVMILSVVHLPFAPTPETWALPDSYYSQLEKAGREQAEAAVSQATVRLRKSNGARELPLAVKSEVSIGHPEETIIETAQAWGADLIVVGSHGHHGLARWLLGSVSQAVASPAPCSVEIVRRASEKES